TRRRASWSTPSQAKRIAPRCVSRQLVCVLQARAKRSESNQPDRESTVQKKTSTFVCRLTMTAVAGAAALLSIPAQAQEKIKLKFADWMPTSHYTVTHGAHPFMDKAKELSQGRIEFQYFPSEQLGKAKDLLTLVQSGAADIVDISPSYISDKFALSSVAELPAMFTTACQGSYAYAELAAEGGILAEREFKPNRIRVLASIAYAPYKVATVGQKVET